MDEISIRIKICDRIYPMKIPKADEEFLRNAAKIINEKVSEYSLRFGTSDNQDLLSIVCFDSLVELMKNNAKIQKENSELINMVSSLNNSINNINLS